MTRSVQKQHERFFVEQAICSLGVDWTIHAERDPLDFIIADGNHLFGLEVADIFVGHQNKNGSSVKKSESYRQKQLNNIRSEYEGNTDIKLCVKFLGCLTTKNLEKVVPNLIALNLAEKPMAYQTCVEIQNGLEAPLKLYVTKTSRSEWFMMSDRVGFVAPNSDEIIAREIESKSNKILQYMSIAGNDVRLLLVANRLQNSGKLGCMTNSLFDFHGFTEIYFYPYPEKVIFICRER